MKGITFLMAAVFMLAFQAIQAHPHKRVVDRHHHNSHQRIQHGARTGALTPHETKILQMQQMKVKSYKQMAMADGHVTPRERQLINRTQHRADRNIYYQKHDRQVRCR